MTAGRLFDEENRGDRAHKGDLAGNLEGELDRGLHARLRRPRVPRPRQTSSSPRVRAARARRQRRRSPGEGRAQVLARIGSRRPPRTDRDDEIRRSDLERDLWGLRRRAVGVPGAPRLLEDAARVPEAARWRTWCPADVYQPVRKERLEQGRHRLRTRAFRCATPRDVTYLFALDLCVRVEFNRGHVDVTPTVGVVARAMSSAVC